MTPEEKSLNRIKRFKKQGLKLKYGLPFKDKHGRQIIFDARKNDKAYKRALDAAKNAHKISYKIRKFFRRLLHK